MSTITKEHTVHISAPADVTWTALNFTLWPSWSAAGFHDPVRDDAQRRFTMKFGSGSGRAQHTVVVSAVTDTTSSVAWTYQVFDVGFVAAAAIGGKLNKELVKVADTLRTTAEEQAAKE